MTSLPPNERPSLLWPVVTAVLWGYLLVQVFVDFPWRRKLLESAGVRLPAFSAGMLDNAVWIVPILGVVTFALAGLLRGRVARWLVPALVAACCILGFLALHLLAWYQLMSEARP